MGTITTSKTGSGVQPRAVHAGENVISVIHSLAAALSAGDVIQLVKIPAGATVTDVVATISMTNANTVTGNIGDGDSSARYTAALSLSANGVVRATVGIPYSYSADDTVDLSITAVTSATIAGSVSISVRYVMNN